jgi:hypothetical protein
MAENNRQQIRVSLTIHLLIPLTPTRSTRHPIYIRAIPREARLHKRPGADDQDDKVADTMKAVFSPSGN